MTDRLNPNSALYWLPKVREALSNQTDAVLIPETISVTVPEGWTDMVFGEEKPAAAIKDAWNQASISIESAILRLGGPPAFLRTDLASAKHSGPSAYQITDHASVDYAMRATLEDNEMKFLGPAWFLVREWLQLNTIFTAFHGHPIAREWRYFARPDRVECKHFYWVENAISFYRETKAPKDWQTVLDKFVAVQPPKALEQIAQRAALACSASPVWSVDFAEDVFGRWWLIDMAVAGQSAHPWDGCEGRPNNERHRQRSRNPKVVSP